MEKKVLVDYKKILETQDDNYLLSGSRGFCCVKDGYIYKFYNDPKEERDFVDLSGYQSSKIAFPIIYFYDQNDPSKIVGEKMIFYDKKSIGFAINGRTDINLLIKHYLDILWELERFPEIRMEDLVSPNILYDKKTGFTIIDTSDWRIDKNNNYFDYNKHLIEYEITDILLGDYLGIFKLTVDDIKFCRNLLQYGVQGKMLLRILELVLDDEDHLIEIIQLYKKIFDNAGKKSIKTIDDMKKYTKRLKNR